MTNAPSVAVMVSPLSNWNLNVDIDFSSPDPRAVVTGKHDRFPAYEMYLNKKQVFRFTPKPTRGRPLPVKSASLEILGLFEEYTLPKRVLLPTAAN
ncbi:MAG: hypothetical protein M3O65_10695 [Actinomycetota bacterium]|nr:hypothetical protein [Actinomycetota bacterium]